jgi:hypothetical protein
MLKMPRTKAELYSAIVRGWTNRKFLAGRFVSYRYSTSYEPLLEGCCAIGAAYIGCGGLDPADQSIVDFCHALRDNLGIQTSEIFDSNDDSHTKDEALAHVRRILSLEESEATAIEESEATA